MGIELRDMFRNQMRHCVSRALSRPQRTINQYLINIISSSSSILPLAYAMMEARTRTAVEHRGSVRGKCPASRLSTEPTREGTRRL